MKTKVNSSSNILDAKSGEVPKQKERHIVSWTQEEDDILREQIRLHGTENWAIIASKFKDKTTRQCRRRWFTYLNSDFKKGGWSPEEDILLCEAQKIYGNRWTEIAKVVSGRTDNAVKNRFTTLCKKKAKREALAKENSTTSYINLNNKRVLFRNGLDADEGTESSASLKRIRHPFAVISQSVRSCEVNFPIRVDANDIKEASTDGSIDNNTRRTYIKKDDPKVLALMQQAELLSSLAIKVNTEKTDQSLENAWTVLQEFLEQNKESQLLTFGDSDADFKVEKFKELLEEIRSCNEGSRSSWREADVYESSPGSSEYSTGSTLLSSAPHDKQEECEAQICVLQPQQLENQLCVAEKNEICLTESTNQEFSSPIRVTPLFGALAAAIPSPKFSESEKHFLMKTLGMESASPSPMANSSQPPPCKRSLLQCL